MEKLKDHYELLRDTPSYKETSSINRSNRRGILYKQALLETEFQRTSFTGYLTQYELLIEILKEILFKILGQHKANYKLDQVNKNVQ